jgi:uncharacterized protein (TIGR02217 family)
MAFLEERLPVEISYGAVYTDSHAVEVITSSSGAEYRRLVHALPLLAMDISYAFRNDRWVYDSVKRLYDRARGRFGGFRVRNHADFSTNAEISAPTAMDEPLALVSAGVYQLQKRYGLGATALAGVGYPVRTIYKPVAGTVLFGVAGAVYPSAQWSVNTTTGRITCAANKTRAVTAITKAVNAVVTVGSHTFTGGESVVFSGVTGMTEINGVRALVVGTTGTTITLALNTLAFSTYTSGGTVQTQPISGEAVTGGCEFDFPCRFDSDLSIEFATYGAATVGELMIKELLNP